jgi:hypothetical protein
MSLRKAGLWLIAIIILIWLVGGPTAVTNFGHLLGTGWHGFATAWHAFWETANAK